jgi:hypothetical protein
LNWGKLGTAKKWGFWDYELALDWSQKSIPNETNMYGLYFGKNKKGKIMGSMQIPGINEQASLDVSNIKKQNKQDQALFTTRSCV